MSLKLSVILVSYNTKSLTLTALRSLYDQTRTEPFETIVVDNASSDGSAEAIASAFPQVNLIALPDNIGFARANNMAAPLAKGEWLLLLNPDTEVYDRAVDNILAFGEANPGGGIYGGRTVFPDGSLNIASCWGRITPWSAFCNAFGLSALFRRSNLFDTEAMGSFRRDYVRPVDIVVGCFLLVRKALWEQLGGFDTSYWMYGEEADLCLRARALGYRPAITPDATIMHLVGASASSSIRKTQMVAKARATLIRRHWSTWLRPWGVAMLWLWCANRTVAAEALGLLRPARYGAKRDDWRAMWKARGDWLAGYR